MCVLLKYKIVVLRVETHVYSRIMVEIFYDVFRYFTFEIEIKFLTCKMYFCSRGYKKLSEFL